MSVDRSRIPPIGPAPTFNFPAITRSRLPNGLRLWCVEHHTVPLLHFLLLLPAGSAADPPGRPGLAALTGDMLDEGSGDRSAIEIHDALDRIGARFETETGTDSTTLAITTLTRHASAGLSLLAEMAMRPALRAADFERVRALRLNRLAQLRDLPPAVAERVFAEALYDQGPYGHLPLGTEASLQQLDLDEVSSFHRRVWRPPGATLVAVGAASAAELADAAALAFADWAPGDERGNFASESGVTQIGAIPDTGSRVVVVHRPGAAQSELRIGHVAASRNTPDYHALLLLNMVLGGQFVSRINLKLREEKGYTYGARTTFEFRRAPGPFLLQVSVQTDATVEAIDVVHRELSAIRGERPPTQNELDLARAALTRGYPRSFEMAEQVARAVAQLALFDLPEDYFTSFVPTMNAVSPEAVLHAAQAYLRPDRLTTVIVGDRDKAQVNREGLGFGRIEEISI
jgi:predicted Zn-dependent peptidase